MFPDIRVQTAFGGPRLADGTRNAYGKLSTQWRIKAALSATSRTPLLGQKPRRLAG